VNLLPLSRPDVGALEKRYVLDALDAQRLAMGPYMQRFEARMAALCGTRHAVAVSSGTAALHLMVRTLDLPPGAVVLTTPFSFVATANVVLYEGLQPRFVDIEPDSYHLDLSRLDAALTPEVRALLAVDVFGMPVDWPALTAWADRHGVRLLDDACEGLGAAIGGKPLGGWAEAAAFGFYPNKQITTGEGGCITTNDDAVALRCRSMRNHGRADDHRMEHVRLGYNYRMDELSAAVGCAQLERLPELSARRAQVAAWYATALSPLMDDLILPAEKAGVQHQWFVYVVRLSHHFATGARDLLMEHLRAHGIQSAPYFPCIHLQPFYRAQFGYQPGDFPVAEAVSASTLALPFFPGLTEADIYRVADALAALLPVLPRTLHRVFVPS
jgi:perosamine synthetase